MQDGLAIRAAAHEMLKEGLAGNRRSTNSFR